jgi:hypothetical protein
MHYCWKTATWCDSNEITAVAIGWLANMNDLTNLIEPGAQPARLARLYGSSWFGNRPAGSGYLGKLGLATGMAIYLGSAAVKGVVVFSSDAPETYITAPTGALSGSGWQYQGDWGGFLGTPISSQYFITAAHVGRSVGDQFTYQGVSYTTVGRQVDPTSDLCVWQINGAFPSYAPLYTKRDEVNQQLVVFGNGAGRGSEVQLAGQSKGWNWGGSGFQQRWGVNQVSGVIDGGAGLGELLQAEFNAGAGPSEAHLSSGDSGGGVFIQDAGVWKLAGINYGVDGPFSTDGTQNTAFYAVLYDVGGFYYESAPDTWVYVPDQAADIPSSFYATRISSHLDWIGTAIPEPVSSGVVICGLLPAAWYLRKRQLRSNGA